MKDGVKIVTQIPLKELWRDNETISARRIRFLKKSEIQELLRQGPTKIAIADVGKALEWFSENECFAVWKNIKNNIADTSLKIYIDEFPDSYAFIASLWEKDTTSVILLEKLH